MMRTAYRSAFRNQRAEPRDTKVSEVSSPVGAGNSTSVADANMSGGAGQVQAAALRPPGHVDPDSLAMPFMDWHELPEHVRLMMLGMR